MYLSTSKQLNSQSFWIRHDIQRKRLKHVFYLLFKSNKDKDEALPWFFPCTLKYVNLIMKPKIAMTFFNEKPKPLDF